MYYRAFQKKAKEEKLSKARKTEKCAKSGEKSNYRNPERAKSGRRFTKDTRVEVPTMMTNYTTT